MIGNNQTCNKPFCDGFKFINCSKKSAPEKEKQTFDKPKWKGDRLDWCVKPGVGWGKDAADLFCKAGGFTSLGLTVPRCQVVQWRCARLMLHFAFARCVAKAVHVQQLRSSPAD